MQVKTFVEKEQTNLIPKINYNGALATVKILLKYGYIYIPDNDKNLFKLVHNSQEVKRGFAKVTRTAEVFRGKKKEISGLIKFVEDSEKLETKGRQK